MKRSLRGLFAPRTMIVLLALLILAVSGCEIEKTPVVRTGSLYVRFGVSDSATNTLISGARIRLDGQQTTRVTPALLSGLSIGTHRVSVFKPCYLDTTLIVEVNFNEVDTVSLPAVAAVSGSIDLIGAPTGTVLIVNNMPVDTVPVSAEAPTVFNNIGVGTFVVSAYLPGYTTEAPSKWTVQVSNGQPIPLSPVFVAAPEGVDVNDLAPPFELRSDWDNTAYRLQDYRGQVCLVSFFFYSCSACIEEFPYIAELYNDPRYAGKIQFLGVDFTDPYYKFAQFRGDHPSLGITFPLLHDPQQTVKTAYNIYNCPANVIVDATGRVRLVQGGISEALLRQTVDEALDMASAPTFDFVMRDTLITYPDSTAPTIRAQAYEFFGRLTNLLNAPRRFEFMVDASPDTLRHSSICTYQGCYASQPGHAVWEEAYGPLQVDTALGFSVVNMKDTMIDSMWIGMPDSLYGDFYMDITVYPADNSTERITHRVHLHDAEPGYMVTSPLRPRYELSSFEHPVNR